jgi:hypothetical protein
MHGSLPTPARVIGVLAAMSLPLLAAGCATTSSAETGTSVAMADGTPDDCPRLPVPADAVAVEDERNLTGDERDAYYRAIFDGWQRNLGAWLDSSCVTDLDPRHIERQQTDGEYGRVHEATFVKAVDAAHLVVQGTVRSIKFVPFGTLTEFAVERTAKGADQKLIWVLQLSALHPKAGFKSGYIGDQVGQPILLPGDEAVLLLSNYTRATSEYPGLAKDKIYYRIRLWSGQYTIKNGKVRKVDGSRIKGVNGLSADRLMDRAAAQARLAPNAPLCDEEIQPCP